MKKINQSEVAETKFNYSYEYNTPEGFLISKGDLIKIRGEYGVRFKFHAITTNTEANIQWVDCFEVVRGQVGALRSFNMSRIKRIPTRGKRAKRVV